MEKKNKNRTEIVNPGITLGDFERREREAYKRVTHCRAYRQFVDRTKQ